MTHLSHSIKLALVAGIATGSLMAPHSALAAPLPETSTSHAADVVSANGYELPVLAYHDVVAAKSDTDEPETVSVDSLVRHFSYLQAKGYTPITLAQLQAASAAKTPLPPKSVLLTFDDGYASFHRYVLPLLKAYKWPAVLAIVGNRIDSKAIDGPAYLTSKQVQELAASGLVEFANHSFNLHHGLVANAWGNSQPAAVTRGWASGRIESDEQWHARVEQDLRKNQNFIAALTGKVPTAMVWPYGRYSTELQAMATKLGLQTLFTLEDGLSDLRTDSQGFRRHLVGREDLEGAIAGVLREEWNKSPVVRIAPVKVGDLVPAPGTAAEPALSSMVARLADLQGNVVAFDPFVREDGNVTGVTYETNVLPSTVSYANRVAAVASGKAGYQIWLSVPLSVQRYSSLTQDQVLQLLEDAAKAVPASGLVVEDADQVPAALVREALARVQKWRAQPVLALRFEHSVPEVAAKATATQAQYVWLRASDSLPAHPVGLPKKSVILEFDVSDQAGARQRLLTGVPNVALSTVPTEANQWSSLFSLRVVPRARIETKLSRK